MTYVPPALRELAEQAANLRRSKRCVKLSSQFCQLLVLVLINREIRRQSPEKCNVGTQTSSDISEEDESVLPICRLIASCDSYPSSSHMQDQLKRLLTCAKHEQRSTVIDTAVVRFLKECQQHFSDAAEHARQELRAICDDKEFLEKKM
ncbi:hypothetical protein COOONC_12015, partial [Cooperia oncophora]